MKKFVWLWNLFHYSLFRWEVYAGNIITYPIRKVLKSEHVRKKYAERGVENPEKIVFNTLNDPDNGVRVILAGTVIIVLTFLLLYGIVNTIIGLISLKMNLELNHFFAMLGGSMLINYFLLFQKNKYLNYFKEFKKMSKPEKNKYGWLSFLVVLSILSLTVISFINID